jgi:TIR domain
MLNERDFNVLLSFAGPERRYAQALHDILSANDLRVFLDEEFKHEIWGKNLVEYLDNTYRDRGQYCLVIMSEAYVKRAYTRVERRAAFDRMINQLDEYVLPVTIDGSWIDGLPRATGYLDLRVDGVVGVCEALLKKMHGGSDTSLRIPDTVAIPRIPLGRLPAEQLSKFLNELCRKQPVTAFGALVYDERTAEMRKLLTDQDYWDALDRVSGPDLEIFALRDEESSRTHVDGTIEMLTAASLSRARSRVTYFSKLLREYFGEEDTRLAYPSFVLFLVHESRVSYCRLIPFRRGTVEELFLRLQDLFALLAAGIAEWKSTTGSGVAALWENLRAKLLEQDYTVYRQGTPPEVAQAVAGLKGFMPADDPGRMGDAD